MNKKFIVPFDTARQLREKGYDVDCYSYYTQNGKLYHDTFTLNNKWIRMGRFLAPTYHEVVDWLYGKKICITCHPAYCYYGQYNGFQYEMQTYDEDDYPDDIYCTREEALNAAILKALEML